MTRIEILNEQLTAFQTERETAVGARLRHLNRRIDTITNVLLKQYNYPLTTVSKVDFVDDTYEGVTFKVLCGNDEWRLVSDSSRLMIQAKVAEVWESFQVIGKN
jgi:hypothetical protein